ncbi:MAG: TonB-dependent receptor [Pseudomonadota bacterium]
MGVRVSLVGQDHKSAKRSTALSLMLSLLLPVSVLPLTASAEEARVLEEIIVTARKREESAQDVPVPITALSGELRKSTVRDLSDLNGFAPNVQISRDLSRTGGSNINIRGISPTRSDDNSFDSPIGVMIDGIYMGSLAGQILENFDLERVEILRGPQGTLFGKNTVGGVVHVIRSRPTGETGARLKVTAGEDGQREFRGVLNFPIMEDKLAGKVFYTNLQYDGFYDNNFAGGKQPEKDYQNFGLTLLATPNDSFEALFTVEKYVDDSQGGAYLTNYNLSPGIASMPSDPRQQDLSGGFLSCLFGFVGCRTDLSIPSSGSADLKNPSEFEVDAYTLNMSLDLNENWTLSSVTGYRDMVEDRKYDFDGTSADFITIERDNVFEQFSQELRLEGSFENVDVVAGLYYWDSEFTQDWITGGGFWSFVGLLSGYSLENNVWLNPDLAAANPGLTPVEACLAEAFGNVRCDAGAPIGPYGANFIQRLFETQETKSTAAFVQFDWRVAEDWTITAGLRWTDEEKDFVAGQAYLAPLDRARLRNFPDFADLSQDWQEVSPKLGVSWQVQDDILVYASYSEGFHSGGFFGVNQNVADFERDQYDPEFSNNYEVGIKSQLLDNRLQINASYFFNDFEDKQEQSVQFDASTNTVATVFSNAASADYSGFEVEVQWLATENLNLFANIGWLDAEYDEFETDLNPNDDAVVGAVVEDASFLVPRNAPELTYGVGGTFAIPIGAGELEIYAKYAYIDEVETNLLNLDVGRLEEREDLAASISYTWDSYRITLFGRNLTDEQFEIPAIIQPLFASGTINQPRHFGLEIEAELGRN